MTVSEDAVTRALSLYCFETIWNEPYDETNVTIQLYPQSQTFLVNSVITNYGSWALPVLGQQYAVYWANDQLFSESLIIPSNTWVSSDTLGASHRTLFHIYSETGLMLPKASVYLYYNQALARVYIAVNAAPLTKIVGLNHWQQLYLYIYRYSAQGLSPLTINSTMVSTPDPLNQSASAVNTLIIDALLQVPMGTFIYVNGYDVSTTTPVILSPGDYVDIYTDTTVIGQYNVNLTTTDTGYFSTTTQLYREILHCPKSVNPNNLIITSELMTLTARRNSDHVGCYIHRNEQKGLTQITHNDIAINTDIIDAYRASLGDADISIDVRIRSHGNKLIREINGIRYLYLCSDAMILTFLIGHGDPSLPFWTAASLEQSTYIGYMTSIASILTPQTMAGFVNGIGYYAAMAALCQHEKNFTIIQIPVNAIAVPKPKILQGIQTYPLVYLNGVKLRDNQIDYTNSRHDKLVFSITPDVYVQIGQTLSVELIESGPISPYLFTPNAVTNTITVPFSLVSIYRQNTLTTPVVGYQTSRMNSYTFILPGPGGIVQVSTPSTGGTLLSFDASSYGSTYMIQNGVFSQCYSVDASDQVTSITPIQIELIAECMDGTTIAPLLGYNSLSVFLNGRRLIPGIDYSANPINDPNGNPALVQVLICNREVLNLTGDNYLEVIAHTSVSLNTTIGYVTGNTIDIKNNTEFWYSGLSTAFANGYLLTNPIDDGNYLTPSPAITDGKPFMIVSEIPSFAQGVLSGLSTTIDDNRLALINTYLNQQTSVNPPGTVIIPKSWQVYSPYFTAIIHDAIQPGTTTIYNTDPDDTLFLQQFSAYDYLLQNDPTITTSISNVDLRYCDVYPCYTAVTVSDVGMYNALHRLAGIILTPDSDTLGDVVNG